MNGLFADFHFLRPLWLLALLALPLLWYALRRGEGDGQTWRGVVDAHLLPHLLERVAAERGRAPHALLGIAWILACIALAGPAWERLPQPLFQNRAARVIALELSSSMLAQDVRPSRVERARYKIADILRRSGDAQTALIAYAGDAFVVAPLTDDANTVANLVDALEPSIMPVPGNDTARAIDLGARLVSQAGLHGGELILVADDASDGAVAAAAKAHGSGVNVSVLGMGTGQGAPIATGNGGFLKDSSGNIAMPKLDAGALAAVASAGGGRYVTYAADARDLDALLDSMRPENATQASAVSAQTSRFLDRGPWLLLLLVPLSALGFRRGWLMIVPLLMLAQPQRADAMNWSDLWSRPDQQAQAALDSGDAKQAQALARDPQLRGAAAYRAEDYANAAQAFDRPDDSRQADAQYNLGNALAKQQKYAEALAAYDRALKQQPDMEDARANRKAIEDFLKKQKQDQNKDGKQKGDKNEQRQSGDDEGSQSAQDEQQQRADRQQGEQKDGDQQAQNRQAPDQQKDGEQEGQQGDQSAGESQGQKNASKSGDDNDKANPGKVSAQPESKAAEQQAQQQFQQSMDQALKDGSGKEQRPQRLGAIGSGKPRDEKQQAVEQWLQRVPDDPGGLLRRKFQLESQHRQQGGGERQ